MLIVFKELKDLSKTAKDVFGWNYMMDPICGTTVVVEDNSINRAGTLQYAGYTWHKDTFTGVVDIDEIISTQIFITKEMENVIQKTITYNSKKSK